MASELVPSDSSETQWSEKMQPQQSQGSMEADRLMVDFISNPNFPKALARIKRAAAENDDEFLADILLRSYLGSTPTGE